MSVAVAGGTEKYEVQARGEMQLAVVIEGLRREGMELAVSPPQVLLRCVCGCSWLWASRRLEQAGSGEGAQSWHGLC